MDQFTHVRIRYRTPTQLGILERFHKTLKEEEIYWQLYETPGQARESIEAFRHRYNEQHPHWAFVPKGGGDPYTPSEVYSNGYETRIPSRRKWAQKAREQLELMMETEAA